MRPMVLVTAPVETRSGYGNHSRDICQALIEMDKYDVRIQSVRWGSTPPNALEKIILFTKNKQKNFKTTHKKTTRLTFTHCNTK